MKQITLRYGAINTPLNTDAATIAELRDEFSATFGIPTDAAAYVNSVKVNEDDGIRSGDTVEFKKVTGTKG